MKKLAMVLAIVLVACLMFVACEKVDPATSSKDTGSQASTPADNTGNTPDTGSPTDTGNPPDTGNQPNPPAPVGNEVWLDFSNHFKAADKGTEYSGTIDIFTVTRGKVATSSGKTVKEGTKNGTSFTAGMQLGTKGSATDKCITFTVPEGKTTVELYVYCGSTGVEGTFNVSVNGTVASNPCSNTGITCVTVTVKGGDAVAIYSSEGNSTNVWGILVK